MIFVKANKSTKEYILFIHIHTHTALKGIMLSEINQTEKDKYCMISDICGMLKQNGDSKNRLVVARGGGYREMGGLFWVFL